MATVHVLGTLKPLDSVKLGRLVLNANHPHQESIDPLVDRPAEAECAQASQTEFKETRKLSKTSKFRSYLGDIFSIRYERQDDCFVTLRAPQATTYDLKNSETWFESACANPATKEFLEKAKENRKNVYLIVGFRTVQNARLARRVTRNTKLQAASTVPAGTGAAIVDPGARGNRDVGNGQELTYKALGEQVFAILYRKVKFKWLSSRDISNMSLERNSRWKYYSEWRGPDEEDEELEDDILEASLTDTDDLDIPDDEYASEDETYYLQDELPGLAGTEKGLQQIWVGLYYGGGLVVFLCLCGWLSIFTGGFFLMVTFSYLNDYR